jgi:DNA-binding Xre family transcriptional regulator
MNVISYKPLWNTMAQKGITTYALINKHGFNPRTIHNLKHNKSITLYTLEKLCFILECQADQIVQFIPDDHS